jgi:LysM domain
VLRPRFALGGFAPLIMIIVIVALAVGYGFGSHGINTGGAPVQTAPVGGAVAVITYRLAPADGHQPSADELNSDVSALSKRLSFIFPMAVDPSGNSVLVAGPGQGYQVVATPPDEIVVTFQADYRLEAGALVEDDDWIRASIGLTGSVEVVGLADLPNAGSSVVDQTPLLTAADIDGSQGIVSDSSAAGNSYGMSLTTDGARRLATYAAAYPGRYLAVLVDHRVFATAKVLGPDAHGTLLIPIGSGLSAGNAGTLHLLIGNGPLPTPVDEINFSTYFWTSLFSPLPARTGPESIPTPIRALTPTPGQQASQYAPSTAGATKLPVSTFFTYRVLPGDTFTGIAAKFRVSQAQLAAANPGVNPAYLLVGQSINIPPPSWSPASPAAAQSPGGAG